jgi:hypothetical protein
MSVAFLCTFCICFIDTDFIQRKVPIASDNTHAFFPLLLGTVGFCISGDAPLSISGDKYDIGQFGCLGFEGPITRP